MSICSVSIFSTNIAKNNVKLSRKDLIELWIPNLLKYIFVYLDVYA